MSTGKRSFCTTIQKFDGDLWYYYIPVPFEIGKDFVNEDNRRVVCTLENKEAFHCALMPDGRGHFFINVNQKRRKALGLVLGQEVNATIEKDHSEFGMSMSEELREVLAQDDDARLYFDNLTPGKQRTLIYWADNVKSSDIKIRRALVLCDHLLITRGKIDFKQLNESIKEANRNANRLK